MLTGAAELGVFYAANETPNWKTKQSVLVKLLIYILEWHRKKAMLRSPTNLFVRQSTVKGDRMRPNNGKLSETVSA